MNDWNQDFKKIQSVLNEWDPIGGTPGSEYDDLAFGIQSRLNSSIEENIICNYVFEYLNNHVGLKVPVHEVKLIIEKIKQDLAA